MSNVNHQPIPTLYVNNIESKVKKDGKSLLLLANPYGAFRTNVHSLSYAHRAEAATVCIVRAVRKDVSPSLPPPTAQAYYSIGQTHTLQIPFRFHHDRLDVVAAKGSKMRGQAFVVFEEISAATAAMRALVGEEFYGRPLVSVWHSVSMLLGCYRGIASVIKRMMVVGL